MTAALEETGISPREYRVLLHALPVDLMQAQVAELSRLGKTTTVVTVDDLEKAGWAVRHPSPADRRVRIVTVTVTEAGRRTAAEGQKITDRVQGAVLGALPESEREAFASALVRLTGGHLTKPGGVPAISRHWIFFANLPSGLAAGAAGRGRVPYGPADRRRRRGECPAARGGATPGAEARHCGRDLRARDLIMAEPPWGDSL
ncbi:MarR family winged helix-turn-helix transcriptional regulator [Actinacidiphila oryziradicis]|uniref:MarR family winged helix-turn-helix transcriptional regulator n=1 Tax=Actinacidiphila oryziradicis TaxID=2571141 RepID=UPI0023F32903|nr:MarR family winged helix-turn-helix transcriptional regulator [Actinacidiphila oryziradicis]MCW2875499.1 MarR family transcriptional regulator [Actinacidiphila oryziradicis]